MDPLRDLGRVVLPRLFTVAVFALLWRGIVDAVLVLLTEAYRPSPWV